MSAWLLKFFLEEECTPYLQRFLLEEILPYGPESVDITREYNFNLFDVKIDYRKRTVTLEDIAAISNLETYTLPLGEFVAALRAHVPKKIEE